MHVCAMCLYACVCNVYVCMYVQCVCMHNHPGMCGCAHAMARGHLGCQPLPFTSFETGFPSCFSIAYAGLAGLQASRILLPLFHISPAPRSVRITGVHIYTASFSLTWVLGIRNQILTLPQQAFYPLSHFPSPSLNCVISFINISVSISVLVTFLMLR